MIGAAVLSVPFVLALGVLVFLGAFIPLIVANCLLLGRAEAFAAKVGAPYAAAVSSGTAGLHLCMRLAGVGPGVGGPVRGVLDEQVHRAVAKVDAQPAFDDDERLVGVLMVVPNKITLQLHDLELVLIHFSDDLRQPPLVEQPQLLLEVDRFVLHVSLRSLVMAECWKYQLLPAY